MYEKNGNDLKIPDIIFEDINLSNLSFPIFKKPNGQVNLGIPKENVTLFD